MLIKNLIVSLIVCNLMFVSTITNAGEHTPETITPPNKQQVLAIPVSQIDSQSKLLDEVLQKLDTELLANQVVQNIEDEQAKSRKEFDILQTDISNELARRHDSLVLQAHRSKLENFNETLTAQMDKLGVQIERIEAGSDRIQEQNQIWKLTLQEVQGSALPPSVVKDVQKILSKIKTYKNKLKIARDQYLELQNKISLIQDAADAESERINMAQQALDAAIFVKQDKPLWKVWPSLDAAKNILGTSTNRFTRLRLELVEYIEKQSAPLFIFGLFICCIGWFLSTRYAANIQLRTEGDSALDVLKYPWSVASLLGFYLTPFLFPDRVLGFKLIIALIALPLWLRVVSFMLPVSIRSSLVIFALLAAIDSLRIAFGGYTIISQWLLALEFMVGFITLFLLLRAERSMQITSDYRFNFWYKLVHGWLKLTTPLLGLGSLAVLFGYTNLAGKIVLPVIWGPIAGAAIFALVRIAEVVFQDLVFSGRLDGLRMIRSHRESFFSLTKTALRGAGLLSWCYLVLGSIGVWDPFREGVLKILTARLGIEPVAFSLGAILAFAFMLWFTWVLARLIDLALNEDVFTRIQAPPGVPFAITTFSRYTIIVVGFLGALSILGFSLDKLTLLVSALGVGIGFGLQNITSNFISGIILLFERPIRVGDKVQLDDLIGHVASIGIRASKITSFEGSDVIVPNADFISSRVINWTFADKKQRVIIPVGVAYGSDPEQVIELLEKVAQANPDVLKDPVPLVLFQNFGESSLDFELRVWTESERGWFVIKSEVAIAISKALTEAEIEIPFPQRDLNLRNIPELRDVIVEALQIAKPLEGKA